MNPVVCATGTAYPSQAAGHSVTEASSLDALQSLPEKSSQIIKKSAEIRAFMAGRGETL